MRCLFLLVFLSLKAYGFLNTSPLYGSAYVLYCIEPAVSSYFYVAWTDDYLLANGATTGSLGIYMEQQHPNTRIPQTIWTFDSQGDDTFLIYMTDPNSPSYQRPLDVRSDGLTPFLGAVGQSSATQIWAIQLWSDERMRLVNTWYNKSLDINIEGLVNNYPINGLFVSVITDRPGQHWELGDSTPQINFTAKSIVATYTSTFIPPVYTSYLADPRVISTVTVILLATQASTQELALNTQNPLQKRSYFVSTIINTVSTVFATSTSITILTPSTIFISDAAAAATVIITSISIVYNSALVTVVSPTTVTAPASITQVSVISSPTTNPTSATMVKGAVTTIAASLTTINGAATTLPATTLTISSFSTISDFSTTGSSSTSTAAAGHGGLSRSDQISIGVGLSMGC